MLTVKPAQLNFNRDGIPCSTQFGDPYFSLQDPIKESQYVFLDSTNITHRWQDKPFTIAELGFGFGINFITTADAWLKNSTSQYWLNYISIEKYPISPKDLIKCHQKLGIDSDISNALIKQYPLLLTGFHRIEFADYKISLTLVFGDGLDGLKQCSLTADAWYLDGFAPNKNADLWSAEIAQHIFRLSKTNSTFSTYSAASSVKHVFSQAGFTIEKQPGFGKKREMLIGKVNDKQTPQSYSLKDKSWLINPKIKYSKKHAIVIGAGMAGVCMAAALAKRKWHVTLIEKHDSIASEGSGNPNAILMPRLSVDHDIQSQLTLLGFLYSQRFLNNLQNNSKEFNWHQCGAVQIPRDDAQRIRMQQIISQEDIPESILQDINQQQASELTNCNVASGGWYIPLAGWLRPKLLCHALINQNKQFIDVIDNTEVYQLEKKNSQWIAHDKHKQSICEAKTAIIANANSVNQFSTTEWCRLHPKRGQISLVNKRDSNIHPSKIICADAYITPEINDHYAIGATFITADTSTEIRDSEHRENLSKIKNMLPDFQFNDEKKLTGRAAIRAVSTDRLPILGPAGDEDIFNQTYQHAALGSTIHSYPVGTNQQGLYIASGFGSRGLAWIPLCSEALA